MKQETRLKTIIDYKRVYAENDQDDNITILKIVKYNNPPLKKARKLGHSALQEKKKTFKETVCL